MNRFYIAKYKVASTVTSRIVLISDIHYYNKKMKILLDKIVYKIKNLQPNYICIPGDFIDERDIYDKEYLLDFFSSLKDIAPVIISIGNHEVKNKHDKLDKMNQELFDDIKSIKNVYLMNNSSLEIDDIRFTCLTFPITSYKENKKSYLKTLETLTDKYPDGLLKNKYNVVLSHSPFTLLHKKVRTTNFYDSCDLILSGHTHGGLTPAFIANATKRVFITPEQHLFPKNSYGYLKSEKTIVSSGITKLSHFNPFRKFNFLFSSEIVVIDLKKEC
jgi:hypothetical protein